jgi:hypothetical protein
MKPKAAIRSQVELLRDMAKTQHENIEQIEAIDAEDLKHSLIGMLKLREAEMSDLADVVEGEARKDTVGGLALLPLAGLAAAGVDFYDADIGCLLGFHRSFSEGSK